MTKIKIETKAMKISVKLKTEMNAKEREELFQKMNAVIQEKKEDDSKQENEASFVPSPIVPAAPIQKETKEEPDEFKIRKRLPNTNAIDLSTLSLSNAETEKALIRCPFCGQSHCAIIKEKPDSFNLLVYDEKEKEFTVRLSEFNYEEAMKMTLKDYSPENKLRMFLDLSNLEKIESNIVVENNSSILCPVCSKLKSFSDWKRAYYTPLVYFETESLCRVCGGEMVEKVQKTKKKGIINYVCEKCGHVENKKEEK